MPRPTVMTPEVIAKLEKRFRDGATNLEAIEGLISEDTFYHHQKINPEFAARMDMAKEYTTEIARGVVSKAIKRGDRDTAKWWLERRNKAQFSTKTETDLTSGGNALSPILVKFIGEDDTKSRTDN